MDTIDSLCFSWLGRSIGNGEIYVISERYLMYLFLMFLSRITIGTFRKVFICQLNCASSAPVCAPECHSYAAGKYSSPVNSGKAIKNLWVKVLFVQKRGKSMKNTRMIRILRLVWRVCVKFRLRFLSYHLVAFPSRCLCFRLHGVAKKCLWLCGICECTHNL